MLNEIVANGNYLVYYKFMATTAVKDSLIPLIFELRLSCEGLESELCGKLELSSAELQCIRKMGAADEVSCGDLARSIGLSPSRTTRVVDSLVERGFASRETGDDRRTLNLRLTRKGGDAWKTISRCETDAESRLKTVLGTETYRELRGTLRSLVDALSAKGGKNG